MIGVAQVIGMKPLQRLDLDTFVALLVALRVDRLKLERCFMLCIACVLAAGTAKGRKAAVRIERIVEGGHESLQRDVSIHYAKAVPRPFCAVYQCACTAAVTLSVTKIRDIRYFVG